MTRFDPLARVESYAGRVGCGAPTKRLRHALGRVVLWSEPSETAGVRERYQCAGITLLCGRRLHLGAGSNAADMRGGRLVFRSSDAPWSVGRWLTFSERIAAIRDHRSDASRADLGHGRCADQEGARASAQAAALRWIEAQ